MERLETSFVGSAFFTFRAVSISKVPREDPMLFQHNAARSNEIKAGLVSPPSWGGGIGRGGRGERKGVSRSHHWSWAGTSPTLFSTFVVSYAVFGTTCIFRPVCFAL